jgi:nucleoside 2-deoxyribosyltransferase
MAGNPTPKTVYMAGPLFTCAQREANTRLAALLRQLLPSLVFVLPQERAMQFLPDLRAVADDCFSQVRNADWILACLDDADADSGTCVEIGYACALGKRIIGYRTDFRGSEIDGVNAMVRFACSHFILASSAQYSLEQLAHLLSNSLS